MIDLEKQLNKLPQAKLSKIKYLLLRWQFLKIKWQNSLANFRFLIMPQKLQLASIITILLIAIVSLPTYAYASNSVTRGNILYPIKQTIEKVELSLADTTEKKVEVFTKLANRRLAEVEELNKESGSQANTNLAETIDEMVVLTVEAIAIADGSSNDQAKEQAIEKIQTIKTKQLEQMEKIANKWGVKANDRLLDSLALAIDDLKKEEEIKNNKNINIPEVRVSTSSEAYKFLHFGRGTTSTTSIQDISIATPTTVIIKSKSDKGQAGIEIMEEYLNTAKEQISSLKLDISSEEADDEQTEELLKRLDDRLQKIREAIDSGNFNQANGLLKSTEALRNNARHFLRPRNATSTPNVRVETRIENRINIKENDNKQ